MLDLIMLEPEQKELLAYMVETIRSVPRDKREMFIVVRTFPGDSLIYPSLDNRQDKDIFIGDLEVLARNGLVSMSYDRNVFVLPLGFQYYEFMKRGAGESVANITAEIKTYIEIGDFHKKYPVAYEKWLEAEGKLWSSDSESQSTVIGHLCREAFQEFVTELVNKFNPPDVDPNKAHDISRLKSALAIRSGQIGKTEEPFLKAMIDYYGAVDDLVQRQEHGGKIEGQQLIWEDARRVVFNVAFVMFEIDRAIG